MQYMLMFRESETEFALRTDPEKSGAYWGAWMDYIQTMQEAGIIESGAGLQPPETATTVRVRDGRRQLHDGPYPESKEFLGGYFLINVPDLDAAIDWAAKSPAAVYGSTEIRPVLPPRDP